MGKEDFVNLSKTKIIEDAGPFFYELKQFSRRNGDKQNGSNLKNHIQEQTLG